MQCSNRYQISKLADCSGASHARERHLDNLECFATRLHVQINDTLETCSYRVKLKLMMKFTANNNAPMTSKNSFGSMPCAETQSVPVFLSDCIAERTACTIATAETSEKTKP